MRVMTLLTDRAEAFRVSRAQFEEIRDRPPEQGRYELLDGEVLVTPSPAPAHQEVVAALLGLLRPLLPTSQIALPAPLDVVIQTADGDTVLQPDLFVGEREHLTDKGYEGPPIIVVEVLSPTTWHRDLGDKMAAYAYAGVPHYWVIAPERPSLTVYRLGADGSYVEQHHVEGDQQTVVIDPVQVTLRPGQLALRTVRE